MRVTQQANKFAHFSGYSSVMRKIPCCFLSLWRKLLVNQKLGRVNESWHLQRKGNMKILSGPGLLFLRLMSLDQQSDAVRGVTVCSHNWVPFYFCLLLFLLFLFFVSFSFSNLSTLVLQTITMEIESSEGNNKEKKRKAKRKVSIPECESPERQQHSTPNRNDSSIAHILRGEHPNATWHWSFPWQLWDNRQGFDDCRLGVWIWWDWLACAPNRVNP